MKKFWNWICNDERREIALLLLTIILLNVIVPTFCEFLNNRKHARESVIEKLEYHGDTIVFKDDDARYVFSGSEIDTLKKMFARANKMAKYCDKNLDFDYRKSLGIINGINIIYDYSAYPWETSAIIIDSANLLSASRIVVLQNRNNFMRYFTKYKKIYQRIDGRKNRKLNILDNL